MLTLVENQVDIWRIDLAGSEHAIHNCRSLLSADEITRADRFYFERSRLEFTVARAAMRQILGWYTNVTPRKLVFSYGANGKPSLCGELEGRHVSFNLSHSNDIALLAVGHAMHLGIDIELVRPGFESEELAKHYFSTSETNILLALPPAERPAAFFSCWTRKEAYIKALGKGLSVPLDSFEVAFGPGPTAALLKVSVDPSEVTRWSMYDIQVVQGYRAALVAEGKGHRFGYVRWELETL